MLAQLQGLHASIEEALSRASGGAAQLRLTTTLDQVAGMEALLAQTLRSGGSPSVIDFSAIARLIQASEATIAAANTAETAKGPLNPADASAATRQEAQTLSHDLFERRIFAPYLHFSSAEDEAEYRAREAERQRAIAAALARQTPEGNLNAGGLTVGQMLDAHTHGAGASPDFLPRWNSLTEKLSQQRAAMHAAGHSTEAFDRRVAGDVRVFLKAKGLSDEEIDTRLAASSAPLETVRPYLANDRDSRRLEDKTAKIVEEPPAASAIFRVEAAPELTVPPSSAAADIDLSVMTAKLQAAGVRMTNSTATASGHGLTVEEQARQAGLGVRG